MAPPWDKNKLLSHLCIIMLVWSNLEGDNLYLQFWTSQAQKHRGEEKEHGGVGASGQSAVAKAEEKTVGKRSSVSSGTGLHVQWILPLRHLFIYTLHCFRVNNEHFSNHLWNSLHTGLSAASLITPLIYPLQRLIESSQKQIWPSFSENSSVSLTIQSLLSLETQRPFSCCLQSHFMLVHTGL